jgi:NHL repeat
VRRHVKASFVGSALGNARLTVIGALLCTLLAFLGSSASASAATKGIVDYTGNPGSTGETIGGRFAAPRGVAVNNLSGDIYVVESGNNRIQRFDEDGDFISAWGRDVVSPGGVGDTNEKQTATVGGGATGGSFTLSFGATAPTTTNPIAFGATAVEVQSALEGIGGIGAGNVQVTGAAGGPYAIEFVGAGASVDQAQITANATGLTPSGTVTTATTQDGASFEICTVAAQCKAGTTIGGTGGTLSAPRGIAVNQSTGDLYVTNGSFRRVEQFSAAGAFVRAWGQDIVRTGFAGDNPAASAKQTLTVSATGGKYTLEFQGQVTTPLATGASAAEIQAALLALSSVGAGNAEVTGASSPFLITFKGSLSNSPQPNIVAASFAGEPLTGGTASVATTTTGSSGFEICGAVAACQGQASSFGTAGAFSTTSTTGAGFPAVVPMGPANAGNVLVPDVGNRRVQEFTSAGAFVRAWGWDVVLAGPGNDNSAPANQFEVCAASSFDVCKAAATAGAGAGDGQFGGNGILGNPTRIAADTAGRIYTVEPTFNFRVQRFTLSGGTVVADGTFAAALLSGSAAGNAPTDVTVDPLDNHLYVVKAVESPVERRILELDTTGSLVDTHLAQAGLNSIEGMALKAGGGIGYLTSAAPKTGVYTIGPPVPPTPIVEATMEVTATSAKLHGTVNPNGGGPLSTSYRFEYRPAGEAAWSKAPAVNVDIGNGETAVTVEQAVSGLQPNRDYEVQLVAFKGGSPVVSTGNAGNFKTLATPPDAQTFAAFWDTSTEELVLRGGVNPNNTATTYYFEYGLDPCGSSACESVPVAENAPAGSGGSLVTRVQRLQELVRGATYHYRIVADNGVEASPGVSEVRGDEMTIEVPEEEDCTNEAFRTGPSSQLPECRAYEWVSDADSGGLGLVGLSAAIGDDGNRAMFTAQVIGSPKSLPLYITPHSSVRTPEGWQVESLFPEAGSDIAGQSYTGADLGSVLWFGGSREELERYELSWIEVSLGGGYSTFGPIKPFNVQGDVSPAQSVGFRAQGISPDLSTVVFLTGHNVGGGVQYAADEPMVDGLDASNLYSASGIQSSTPSLAVVNREDGKLGPVIGGNCGAGLGGRMRTTEQGTLHEGAVSRDGSVIYFSVRPGSPATGDCPGATPKRLFKRIDDEHTVRVSEPQCSPACGGPDGNDEYRGASSDGSVVYFTTPRRLLNADGDNSVDLYVYDADPPSGQPSLALASGASGAEVSGVLRVAADGTRAYFSAKGTLAGPSSYGASPVAGQRNLYVYQRDEAHPTGRVAFVGTIDSSDDATYFHALPRHQGVGDGHLAVFLTAASLLQEDADSRRDAYRYDDDSGQLRCLSCMGSAGSDVLLARGSSSIYGTGVEEQVMRVASADGTEVLFTTKEGLVDEDLNGAYDTYLWRNGSLSLVSAGNGEAGISAHSEATTAAISPDGDGVFFLTRTALLPSDDNNARDLYVARVGGGFPEPAPPVICNGPDGCQGPQSQQSTGTEAAGSDSFSGPGNRAATKPCGKGKVRKKGSCVKVKKAGKGHKQGKRRGSRAGGDRGGNR